MSRETTSKPGQLDVIMQSDTLMKILINSLTAHHNTVYGASKIDEGYLLQATDAMLIPG